MPAGRPRTFDINKALDRALEVFWRKGYEGTTLPDLTKAMRINRPSLYAAFGNKEALFRKALDRYAEGPGAFAREALEQPTARGVVERLLQGTVQMLTNPRNPCGCLVVQGALACGEEADAVRKELIARRLANEAKLCQRLKQAKAEGDLPANTDPTDLARYVTTLLQGMAVQAASGANRSDLRKVAQMAMRAWPD